jgi:DNA-binding XRE family transcriptional regulator
MDRRLSEGLRWGMPADKKPTHAIEDKKALGRCLAEARSAAGFTQSSAAADLELVKQTISSWESGTNLPDALWLRRLARLYKTSVSQLVGDEAAGWPFRRVPVGRVAALEPEDLAYVEGALAKAVGDVSGEPSPEDLKRFQSLRGSVKRASGKRKSA